MKRWILTCLAMLSLLTIIAGSIASPAAAAPGGNSVGSAACENGGYLGVTRTDKTGFKNEGQCAKYTAQGGVLKAKPTAVVDFIPIPSGAACQARLTVTGYEPGDYSVDFGLSGFAVTMSVDSTGYGSVMRIMGALLRAGSNLSPPMSTVWGSLAHSPARSRLGATEDRSCLILTGVECRPEWHDVPPD